MLKESDFKNNEEYKEYLRDYAAMQAFATYAGRYLQANGDLSFDMEIAKSLWAHAQTMIIARPKSE